MPNLSVSVPHQLSQDEALTRVKRAIALFYAQYSDKAKIQESWNGYTGEFSASGQGQTVPTTVTVNPGDVTVNVTLPTLALMFKSKIEATLKDVLTKALA